MAIDWHQLTTSGMTWAQLTYATTNTANYLWNIDWSHAEHTASRQRDTHMKTYRRIKLTCPTPVSFHRLLAWMKERNVPRDTPVRIGVGLYATYPASHELIMFTTSKAIPWTTAYIAYMGPNEMWLGGEASIRSTAARNRILSLLPASWDIVWQPWRTRYVPYVRTTPLESVRPLIAYAGFTLRTDYYTSTLARGIAAAATRRTAIYANARRFLAVRDSEHLLYDVMRGLTLTGVNLIQLRDRLSRIYKRDVFYCRDCTSWDWDDNAVTLTDFAQVCESCSENYSTCADCDDQVHSDDMWNGEVCNSCRDANYWYCEPCGDYHHNDDACPNYESECDCVAPHMRFEFPCNGHGVAHQDERFEIAVGKGEISDAGIRNIIDAMYYGYINVPSIQSDLLANGGSYSALSELVSDLGFMWQTKDGNYTRRLSRALYKKWGLKLSPDMISAVGNIGRNNTLDAASYHLELTRDLNLSPHAFVNGGSCWWGSYSTGRCSLKSVGGLGIRAFPSADASKAEGRAWIMPLNKNMQPTHDAMHAHAFVVFNGYGTLQGYTAARLVAQMARMTYRKIEYVADPMSVNGGSAYLIADQETCSTVGSITLYLPTHGYTETAVA